MQSQMAVKRRVRRVSPNSIRPRTRAQTSRQVDEISDSVLSTRKLIAIFGFFFVLIPAISVLIYRNKHLPRTPSSTPHKNLRVKTDVNFQEILSDHADILENVSLRHYKYPMLAYITPWNRKGYEIAKTFGSKFTHLSPVWYDLKSQGTGLTLEGRHNADIGWISDVRMRGNAQVLPRIVLEVSPVEFFRKKMLRNKAVELIVKECKEMDYDGIVLESWSRWAAYGILLDPDTRNTALQFIKDLGNALHSASPMSKRVDGLKLIYVIGPPRSEKLQAHDFGPEDLKSLTDAVDGFSLMTYDFSGPQHPGPNAPLKWIIFTLQVLLGSSENGPQDLAKKIFVGINFYGNDFILSGGSGGGAITGPDYLSLLEKHRPVMEWEKNSKEHYFSYGDDGQRKHVVFYPSLMSVSLRLEQARLLGTGISIWEIGQGREFTVPRGQSRHVYLSSSHVLREFSV